MQFDFPTIMVLAVLITGVIWALDAWLWAPKRRESAEQFGAKDVPLTDEQQEEKEKRLKEPVIVEYSRSLFPVILIVLILRSFLIEPFRIPSGSMMPTLLDGDFILVNKFTYGIRLPVINKKIIGMGAPQRGDVAVFRYPNDPSVDYIKRVIGLPGDHIVYRNKKLYINGELMPLNDLGRYEASGVGITMAGAQILEEDLTAKKHHILVDHDRPVLNMEYRVAEDEYFVMGDNRDNSNDSRFWGTVPERNLVGRAFMIWMNWDGTNNGVTWSRIGQTIE
ncbi:MAG TPA: signal peptidase I [Gammaproteobacteria bacterium]